MSENAKDGAGTSGGKQRITLERFYRADVQDIWDLWTTKEGIESWWGPGGFAVKVRKPDHERHVAFTATRRRGLPSGRPYRV